MSPETIFVVSYLLIHLTRPTLLKGTCGSNVNFTKWQQISPAADKYTLIQSNVYMRHGDRTQNYPIQCFNDTQPAFYCEQTMDIQSSHPNASKKSLKYEIKSINGSNIMPGTCLIGQLTSNGYNQCFSVGQRMKQRYSNHYKLLPISIKTNKRIPIYLRADTMSRVQLSLMAFFDGLYQNNIDVTVPLFNADKEFDIIVPSYNVCPYLKTIRQTKNSNLYNNYHTNITLPLLQKFNAIMSYSDMNIDTIFDCGNVLACSNKYVPENYTQQLFDEIIQVRTWNAWFRSNHPNYIDATKYNSGPLLKSIFGQIYNGLMCDMYNMYDHDNCIVDNYKLFVYGGHDSGVAALLGALEVDMRMEPKWIPYASFVSFELFKNNENHKYYVLMSYNGKILTPSMCDCDTNEYYLCEWNNFKHFMLTITPRQYECPGMKNIPEFEDKKNMFDSTIDSSIIYTYTQSNLNEYDNGSKKFLDWLSQNKLYITAGMACMVVVFVMLVVIGILYTKQQPATNVRYRHQNDCSN